MVLYRLYISSRTNRTSNLTTPARAVGPVFAGHSRAVGPVFAGHDCSGVEFDSNRGAYRTGILRKNLFPVN